MGGAAPASGGANPDHGQTADNEHYESEVDYEYDVGDEVHTCYSHPWKWQMLFRSNPGIPDDLAPLAHFHLHHAAHLLRRPCHDLDTDVEQAILHFRLVERAPRRPAPSDPGKRGEPLALLRRQRIQMAQIQAPMPRVAIPPDPGLE